MSRYQVHFTSQGNKTKKKIHNGKTTSRRRI
uniref:Uncharacterized protein n=1 Tax=Rhizophora mucronata TaxID=61149 RepID=A0A2P2Q7Q4_RHIMU